MPGSVPNTSHEPSPLNLTGFHQDQCGYDSHFTSEQTEARSRSVAGSGLEPRLFSTLRNRAGAQGLVAPFFQIPQNAHSAPCPKAPLVLQFTKVPKHSFTLIYHKPLYFGPFVLIQVAPLNFAETVPDKLPVTGVPFAFLKLPPAHSLSLAGPGPAPLLKALWGKLWFVS